MASIDAVLRYRKRNGKWAVYVRIIHNRKLWYYKTGIECYSSEFDKIKGKFKNLQKQSILVPHLKKISTKWAKSGVTNINEWKSYINDEKENKSEELISLLEQLIADLHNSRSYNTLRSYKTTLENVKEFANGDLLSDLSFHWYERFKEFLLEKGLANDSVGVRIKNLKSLLRQLIKLGFSIPANLRDWGVEKSLPRNVYLTSKEVTLLYGYKPVKGLQNSYDLLIIALNTGLRISDLLKLNKNHLQGNFIKLRATKNRKDVIIPLLPKVKKIFEKHDYSLPKISEQNLRLNVKKILKKAKIKTPTEIHKYKGSKVATKIKPKWKVFRIHDCIRTFITLCFEKGIPIADVSLMTGKSKAIILQNYYSTDEKGTAERFTKAFSSEIR